jgi:DnaJ domain
VQVARRLWELGHGNATGTLRVVRSDSTTAPLLVELYNGWVHAVSLSPAYSLVGDAPERGEDKLRVFLRLSESHYRLDTFSDKAKAEKRGACQPFHPAQVVRNHVDSQALDQILWRAHVGGGKVQIAKPPHPSCLGLDERPLVAYLTRPRTLAEIDAAAFVTPDRTARLISFLDAMAALQVTLDAGASPYAALELAEGASLEEVKRAYRRLARELHPDLHPGLSPEELDELERRFAEVSAAYRRLV